jgi:predicted transcriptional regulator
MARQGCSLSKQEVERILTFLVDTEMTISEIAERMMCTRGTIAAINRRFQVRKYAGLKSRWILADNTLKM